jgi:hypothetical protein
MVRPRQRYATVDELAAEVRSYLAGLPVRAHREGLAGRLRRWVRKYRLPLALVLAYVVMRVLVLLLTGY